MATAIKGGKFMKKAINILFVFLFHTSVFGYNHKPPRLVVVMIIDQFSYSYINKLFPRLKYGLRYLLDNGVVYTNAYMPHGQPGTSTGHAGLNTGTCADYHGFTSNTWYENGEKVACDDDFSGNALVIDPRDGSTYDYGKSAIRLKADGISDQCALQTEPSSHFAVYSISGKSRSAIAAAGSLGKAVWFDTGSGLFTSSKAYFDHLPEWLQQFNKYNDCNRLGSVMWERMYPQSPYAYNFFNINNYDYARIDHSILDISLPVYDETHHKNPYHYFQKMPQSNQLIFDCAHACIKTHVGRKHRDRLLLWVCLSPLDKVGHQFGPDSLEAIDMVYHLDKQIQRFMRQTLRIIGKHEVVFVVTADHGVMSFPELLRDQGLQHAQRVERLKLIERINKQIEEKHDVKNLVIGFKSQELVVDPAVEETLSPEEHEEILWDMKLWALKEPGVKNVWTHDELLHLPTQPGTLEDNIKHQLFKGRNGSIIIQPDPYMVITQWNKGASHKTPYNYDTHVPVIIFNSGKFERRFVRKRVAALQLANTIAEIFNVPKPSASTYDILPELFDPEYK